MHTNCFRIVAQQATVVLHNNETTLLNDVQRVRAKWRSRRAGLFCLVRRPTNIAAWVHFPLTVVPQSDGGHSRLRQYFLEYRKPLFCLTSEKQPRLRWIGQTPATTAATE